MPVQKALACIRHGFFASLRRHRSSLVARRQIIEANWDPPAWRIYLPYPSHADDSLGPSRWVDPRSSRTEYRLQRFKASAMAETPSLIVMAFGDLNRITRSASGRRTASRRCPHTGSLADVPGHRSRPWKQTTFPSTRDYHQEKLKAMIEGWVHPVYRIEQQMTLRSSRTAEAVPRRPKPQMVSPLDQEL